MPSRVQVLEGLGELQPDLRDLDGAHAWAASGGHNFTAGTPRARAMAMYGGDARAAWS
jgi:hypothetical protein